MAKITLATCQFPISRDVDANLRHAVRQIEQAAAKGAQLVHFSEAALSGYLGVEIKTPAQIGWEQLRASMREVMAQAQRSGVWVVIGCNHQLSGRHKPHNSLYVINGQGKIVNRYDKMFCTGGNEREGDLRYYSPGSSFVTFRVGGVKCGLLICHDFRYPELFRAYKRQGVELMLVSFHNAAVPSDVSDRYKVYVRTTVQAAAASNYFAVSANNNCCRHAWPSFVSSAEGLIASQAPAHRPQVLITTIDTKAKLYDASAAWRERCMRGVYHSGTLVKDARSRNRKGL